MNTPQVTPQPPQQKSTSTQNTTLQTIKRIGTALSLSAALITGTAGCKTDSTKPTPTTETNDNKTCPEDKKETPEKNDNLNAEDLFLTAMIKYKDKKHERKFAELIQKAAAENPGYVLEKIAEHSNEFKHRQHLFLYAIEQLIKEADPDNDNLDKVWDESFGWAFGDKMIKIMREKWGTEGAVTLKTAETKLQLSMLDYQWIAQPHWKAYAKGIQIFEDPYIRDHLRIRLAEQIEEKKHNTGFSYLSVEINFNPKTHKQDRKLDVSDFLLTLTLDLITQLETKDKKNKEHEFAKIILRLSIDIGDDFLEGKERTQAMTQIMKILAQYPECNRLTKPLQETYTLASKMDNPSLSGEQKQKIVEQVEDKLNKMFQELYDTDAEINFD